jgi:hypothetical protein
MTHGAESQACSRFACVTFALPVGISGQLCTIKSLRRKPQQHQAHLCRSAGCSSINTVRTRCACCRGAQAAFSAVAPKVIPSLLGWVARFFTGRQVHRYPYRSARRCLINAGSDALQYHQLAGLGVISTWGPCRVHCPLACTLRVRSID